MIKVKFCTNCTGKHLEEGELCAYCEAIKKEAKKAKK